MKLNGLVLAAGLSSRMGAFKPLMHIGDKTLIEYSVESLFRGGAEAVTVVLGLRASEVQGLLSRVYSAERVRFAINSAYETTDMLASIKTGIAALAPCDAFFLLPGDMPAVAASTMSALASALADTDASVALPTIDGHRKHPPLIRASCSGDILSYDKEGGLRGIWHSYERQITEVAVQDRGCLLDADNRDDFLKLSRYLESRQNLLQTGPEPAMNMIG